ncbi:hypothetical protein BB558_003606 [Smittium angustum]|uniref:Tim10-like domain-containing protein n=1 Tax=Smittium angustum TaxID=133377 RepID=A0A2U1J5L1_SMIAN|nr:hypothetical protein BB558_003606 [Smittium angustum]
MLGENVDPQMQKELQKFVETEQAKAQMQSTIHEFTSRCWEKCISNSKSGTLDKSESSCLENCVNRFIDSSVYIVRNLQNPMKPTILLRASTIKWHKHTPLINFIGPRKNIWKSKAAQISVSSVISSPVVQTVKSVETSKINSTVNVFSFIDRPEKYKPRAMTAFEIEAIESGGASLTDA